MAPGVFNRKAVGELGEQLAADYLSRSGYSIVYRNWRSGKHEIDLVVMDADQYVMVEVRTRRGKGYGSPEESITRKKRERMRQAGLTFLLENGQELSDWRLDVIAIELDAHNHAQRMDHYVNVVEETD